MVKFTKNDRLDALIVLAIENDPKGGPLDDFLLDETLKFGSFFSCS